MHPLTKLKNTGRGVMWASGAFTLWQGYDTLSTVVHDVPMHPIGLAKWGLVHGVLAALGFLGYKGSRSFVKDAQQREIRNGVGRRALTR